VKRASCGATVSTRRAASATEMDISERFEQLIAFLGSQLPAPVDERAGAGGAIVFTGGDPPEVVVELTASSVIVSEFAGVWEQPYALTPRPRRVGAVNWKRLPETPLLNAISQLVRGAGEMRRTRYRTCQQCGAVNPPEWMYGDDVCHKCAERELGPPH
jgi:hypothetical protein